MPKIQSYKLANGQTRYKAQIYLGKDKLTGKRQYTTRRGFKSKDEAMLTIARVRLNLEEKKTKSFTYREIYDEWLKEYEPSVRDSTLLRTKRMFRLHILPVFGHLKIDEVKPLLVQQTMNDWNARFVKASAMMNYVNSVFDFALRMQLINQNPVTLIKKPRRTREKSSSNFYDRKQLKMFMDTAKKLNNKRAYLFFRILAFTGMRRGEVLALEWSDFNLKKKTVHIHQTVTRGQNGLYISSTKTLAGDRTITLDSATVDTLNSYQDKHTGRLFKSSNGGILSPSKPRKWYEVIVSHTDLPHITIHGFRHTHASLLFESGANLKEVQYRLGHSDSQTTLDIYTHVTNEAKENLATRFDNYVDF